MSETRIVIFNDDLTFKHMYLIYSERQLQKD